MGEKEQKKKDHEKNTFELNYSIFGVRHNKSPKRSKVRERKFLGRDLSRFGVSAQPAWLKGVEFQREARTKNYIMVLYS